MEQFTDLTRSVTPQKLWGEKSQLKDSIISVNTSKASSDDAVDKQGILPLNGKRVPHGGKTNTVKGHRESDEFHSVKPRRDKRFKTKAI